MPNIEINTKKEAQLLAAFIGLASAILNATSAKGDQDAREQAYVTIDHAMAAMQAMPAEDVHTVLKRVYDTAAAFGVDLIRWEEREEQALKEALATLARTEVGEEKCAHCPCGDAICCWCNQPKPLSEPNNAVYLQ